MAMIRKVKWGQISFNASVDTGFDCVVKQNSKYTESNSDFQQGLHHYVVRPCFTGERFLSKFQTFVIETLYETPLSFYLKKHYTRNIF